MSKVPYLHEYLANAARVRYPAALLRCKIAELDYSNSEMPEVDRAILEEYQRMGYAFEASKILPLNVFENESIKCIVWNAFRSNKASCRIAEKLGGKVVEGKIW